jgi:hypothetical protein
MIQQTRPLPVEQVSPPKEKERKKRNICKTSVAGGISSAGYGPRKSRGIFKKDYNGTGCDTLYYTIHSSAQHWLGWLLLAATGFLDFIFVLALPKKYSKLRKKVFASYKYNGGLF